MPRALERLHDAAWHKLVHVLTEPGRCGIFRRRDALVVAHQMLDEKVHVANVEKNELGEELLELGVLVHQLVADRDSKPAIIAADNSMLAPD